MDRPRRKSTSVVKYSESPGSPLQSVKPSRRSMRINVHEKMKTETKEEQENIQKDLNSPSPKKKRRLSTRNRTPSSKALESITTENSPSVGNLDSPSSLRKSSRNKTPSKKYTKEFVVPIPNEEKKKSRAESTEEDEDVEVQEVVEDGLPRPTDLFEEGYDVDGKEIFGFKTPGKKGSMLEKAVNTPKSTTVDNNPRTPKSSRKSVDHRTPRSGRNLMNSLTPKSSSDKISIQKTPRVDREKLRRRIKAMELDSDDDFSGSESDYSPSDDSSSESEDQEEQKEEVIEIEESPPKRKPAFNRILKTPSTKPEPLQPVPATGVRRSQRIKNDVQLFLKSDDYFSTISSKNKTSNHTLDRLKTPRLNHERLHDLLSKMELSSVHQKAIQNLNQDHKYNFDRWTYLFKLGYSVLLHGLGSKRNLMQEFHKRYLQNEHVIVVNGFYPDLSVKDILVSIAEGILGIHGTSSNLHEVVDLIKTEMSNYNGLKIYLIVHDLDGAMLRNEKAQNVLSRLAGLKNIHLIASIDHINAPMLWDQTKCSSYNFSWWDVTTMLPYEEETRFENSLMVENSGALELSSLKHVFQSLNSNAKSIYKLIVDNQLKNGNSHNYPGMSFKDLYAACRESFYTSSVIALRAQLTEFLDHKLARNKRDASGAEYIIIPIKNHLLEQFLNENF